MLLLATDNHLHPPVTVEAGHELVMQEVSELVHGQLVGVDPLNNQLRIFREGFKNISSVN